MEAVGIEPGPEGNENPFKVERLPILPSEPVETIAFLSAVEIG